MNIDYNLRKALLAENLIAYHYKDLSINERILLAQHKFDFDVIEDNNGSQKLNIKFHTN